MDDFIVGTAPGRGRFLVAARDLAVGAAVLSAEPYVWVPADAQRLSVCSRCMASGVPLTLCPRCSATAWCAGCVAPHDDAECRALRRLPVLQTRAGVRGDYVRLVLRALLKAGDTDGLPAELDALCPTKHEAEQGASDEKRAEAAVAHAVLPKTLRFSLGDVLALVCKAHENSFGVWFKKGRPLGVALLVGSACLLNSSCAPTCARGEPWQQPQLLVRVIRPVKRGEELSISYYGPALDVDPTARRQYLAEQWGFDCACERCGDEASWRPVVERCVCSECSGWMCDRICVSCGHGRQP